MSFIYGIVNLDNKPVKKEEVHQLASAVTDSVFIENTTIEGSYALGYCHRQDRDAKAGIYKSKDVTVLADIRIYNVDKLKEIFSFETFEEAFAKAYLKWGNQCANHINGDFSVIVIDHRSGEVFMFRDHIGARPLAYSFEGSKLIFASHEFGIAKSKLTEVLLSEENLLSQYFRLPSTYSQTVFQNIYKVFPGHFIQFVTDDKKHEEKYWKPEQIVENKKITFKEAVAQVRKLLLSATHNRIEEGKNGVHVSSGLDSTGIACILADKIENKENLIGYSWTPEEIDVFDGIDEKELIEIFAKEKNVKINYLKLSKNEHMKSTLIPEFEKMNIELPTMKNAGNDNVKTLFSGWGGDEFLSLSTRGTFNHLFFKFKWWTLAKMIRFKGIKWSLVKAKVDILPLLIPFGLLSPFSGGRNKVTKSKLSVFKKPFVEKHKKQIFEKNNKNIFGYGDRRQFALNLLYNMHVTERIDSWAINAERYGIEYKYPLLDKDVLEYWFSLPIKHTYHKFHSRLLYRASLKGILTEKIRMRRDKGEGMRIAYTQQQGQNSQEFIKNEYLSIAKDEHLPYFNIEKLNELAESMSNKRVLERKRGKINGVPALYLRYVKLVKKYL
ncbi:MAG: hypothetical protein COA67_12435 [Lutibacter sp.]|nr:MAG: hypothetical protein COA67_12435 [Lutibacter sp.]